MVDFCEMFSQGIHHSLCSLMYYHLSHYILYPWNGPVLDQIGATSFALLWHHFKIIIFHRTWNYTLIIQINSISQLSQCFLSVLSHFHKTINKVWIVPSWHLSMNMYLIHAIVRLKYSIYSKMNWHYRLLLFLNILFIKFAKSFGFG